MFKKKKEEKIMAEEKEVKAEKKEAKKPFALQELPTQTAIFITNNITGEVMTEQQALAEILNKLSIIEKSVA
jgi:hypothetical protein